MSKELKVAKLTIDKAEEMQKKRHKNIDESVRKIKDIMNQKLIVEISQVSDTTEVSGTPGGPVVDGGPVAGNGNVGDKTVDGAAIDIHGNKTPPTERAAGTTTTSRGTVRTVQRNQGGGSQSNPAAPSNGISSSEFQRLVQMVESIKNKVGAK